MTVILGFSGPPGGVRGHADVPRQPHRRHPDDQASRAQTCWRSSTTSWTLEDRSGQDEHRADALLPGSPGGRHPRPAPGAARDKASRLSAARRALLPAAVLTDSCPLPPDPGSTPSATRVKFTESGVGPRAGGRTRGGRPRPGELRDRGHRHRHDARAGLAAFGAFEQADTSMARRFMAPGQLRISQRLPGCSAARSACRAAWGGERP